MTAWLKKRGCLLVRLASGTPLAQQVLIAIGLRQTPTGKNGTDELKKDGSTDGNAYHLLRDLGKLSLRVDGNTKCDPRMWQQAQSEERSFSTVQ